MKKMHHRPFFVFVPFFSFYVQNTFWEKVLQQLFFFFFQNFVKRNASSLIIHFSFTFHIKTLFIDKKYMALRENKLRRFIIVVF